MSGEPEAVELEVSGVSKRFGSTEALREVSFVLRRGEVLALLGENGAGKSTLMKVLSGAVRPDAGSVRLGGQVFLPRDPLHARRAGISMIYQELTLAPDLTVAENITLGSEPRRAGWVRRGIQRARAREALAQLGAEGIPLDVPAGRLGVAQQQLVEIARALAGRPRVLILDEPTSSLSQRDAEHLFEAVDRLRRRGVAIIYISHFLEECGRVASRYLVLRDGAVVGAGEMAVADPGTLVRAMVGREVREIYPFRRGAPGESVLEAAQVAGRRRPAEATLTLRRGEILGIAGLIGSGRTELLRVLFGLDRLRAGRVRIFSREEARPVPGSNLRRGMGMVSEDRKGEGLLLNRSVADNLTMTGLSRLGRAGWVNRRRQGEAARLWMRNLEVKAASPHQPVGELSGGNQQKVALGRLLFHGAEILLLDEPTRGIDVGSKAQIYDWMNRLAAEGKAVLFVSSYLPELLGVCDRIAVMSRGTLGRARPAAEWTEHAIMLEAMGQEE